MGDHGAQVVFARTVGEPDLPITDYERFFLDQPARQNAVRALKHMAHLRSSKASARGSRWGT